MDTDVIHIAKGTMYLITQNVLNILINVVAFAFIARILTTTEMGVTVALSLILGIAGLLSDLGLGDTIRRHIAEYRGRKKDYSVFIQVGIVIRALISIIIAIIIVLGAPWISLIVLKTSTYTFLFQLLGLDLICVCLNSTLMNILWGLDKIREMSLLNVLATSVRQVAVLVLLFSRWGLIGCLIGWTVGDFLYSIGTICFLLNKGHLKNYGFLELYTQTISLLKFSLPLFTSSATIFLYNWFDKTVLLSIISAAEVGIYNVASRAYALLATFPQALITSIFPYYGERYGEDQHQKIIRGMQKASRYTALLYTPLALGIATTATYIITIFAGDKYSSGGIVLTVLCLFSVAWAIIGIPLGGLLLVYKKTSTILVIQILSTGTCLAISFVFMPQLGILSMAIIVGIAMVLSSTLTMFALRSILPIKIDIEAIWKSLCSGAVMVISIKAFQTIYPAEIFFPFYIAVGGISYFLMLRAIKALRVEDIELTEQFLGGKFNLVVKVLGKLIA